MLHSRAGEWYEKSGQYVPAVDQFVRARDLGRAFGILHEHVAHDWFANNPTDFDAWLHHLSAEDVRAHRGRMVDYAIALGLAGKVEEQGRWLALASSTGSDDGGGESAFDLRMAAATAHWHGMRGDPEPAIAFERDVVPHVKPGTDFVLDQFPVVSARAHLYNGQPTAAITTCDRGLTIADHASRAVLLGIRGRAMFELGQLDLAQSGCRPKPSSWHDGSGSSTTWVSSMPFSPSAGSTSKPTDLMRPSISSKRPRCGLSGSDLPLP